MFYPEDMKPVKVCHDIIKWCQDNGDETTRENLVLYAKMYSDKEFSRLASCCRQLIKNGLPSSFVEVHFLQFEDMYNIKVDYS